MLKRHLPTPQQRQEAFEKALRKANERKPRTALKKEGTRAKRNKAKLKETGYKIGECCERCGSRDNLVAHHLRHRSTHPLLVAEPLNLATVCSSCHDHAHRYQFDFDLEYEFRHPGRFEVLDEIEQSLTKTPRRIT